MTDRDTLADVDHTHPHTNRAFGDTFAFARGGVVAADGGRPDGGRPADERDGDDGRPSGDGDADDPDERRPADERDADDPDEESGEGPDEEPQTLADVSHTPPNDSEDANRTFERGKRSVPDDE